MKKKLLPFAEVRCFASSSSLNESRLCGTGRGDVDRAGLHRDINLVRRHVGRRRAGRLEHHVHLAAAAANLDARDIGGLDDGLVAAGDAARLPDPGDDFHALGLDELRHLAADLGGLPLVGLIVAGDDRRHEGEVQLGDFAAGIGRRIEREIDRAFLQRVELREGLHERGIRIDLEFQSAVGLRLDLLREAPHEAVAEIALVAVGGGKLVRDFQHPRLRERPARHAQKRGRGDRAERGAAGEDHENVSRSARPLRRRAHFVQPQPKTGAFVHHA